jgi:hypothetical protein
LKRLFCTLFTQVFVCVSHNYFCLLIRFTKLLLFFLSVSVRLFSNAFISICFHKTIHYSDCFHMFSFSLFANKHLFINLSFSPYYKYLS